MLRKELKEKFEKEFGVEAELSFQNADEECFEDTYIYCENFKFYVKNKDEDLIVSTVFMKNTSADKVRELIKVIKQSKQADILSEKVKEQESVIDDFSKEIARLQTIIDKSMATKSVVDFAQDTILKAIKGEK